MKRDNLIIGGLCVVILGLVLIYVETRNPKDSTVTVKETTQVSTEKVEQRTYPADNSYVSTEATSIVEETTVAETTVPETVPETVLETTVAVETNLMRNYSYETLKPGEMFRDYGTVSVNYGQTFMPDEVLTVTNLYYNEATEPYLLTCNYLITRYKLLSSEFILDDCLMNGEYPQFVFFMGGDFVFTTVKKDAQGYYLESEIRDYYQSSRGEYEEMDPAEDSRQ